jgi:transmembrane sensor
MTAGSDKAKTRASGEATEWLILLQENPADISLRHRFEAWLGSDPIHDEAWRATQQTAGMLAGLSPRHESRWRAAVVRADASGPGRRQPKGWQIGFALLAAMVCVALIETPAIMMRLRADYATGTAQTEAVTLADGSTVTLAPNSAIAVAYRDEERRVSLLKGEAFFNVDHDVDRPFRVAVGHIEMTDTGTAFNVHRRDDGATIAVQQGSVRIDYPGAPSPVSETLAAEQTLRVDWDGAVVRGKKPKEQIASWRWGQLVAQDQPMGQVLDKLRPYFPGTIIFANSTLSARPVTGSYNLTNPVEALRAIAEAHGASVHQLSDWIIVISSD